MPSPKTPAQTDGRGSAGGGKGGRKRRSRQQPGGTTTTPTTPQTPDFQSQALASPDSRAADQVTEQQLLALKGQQEAAHEMQLAEVAKKEKAAADAHASAEAAKQAAAETALRLEEKRVDLESMIKNLQKQAVMLRSEEQKANAKYDKLQKSDVAETASEEHAKAIAAAEETKDELDTTNAITTDLDAWHIQSNVCHGSF